MYIVLDIRHGAPTLDEILDGCKIVFLAMFEALTIVKDEIHVLGRDYFDIDVRYARLAVCYVLAMTVLWKKFMNAEVLSANLLLSGCRKQY